MPPVSKLRDQHCHTGQEDRIKFDELFNHNNVKVVMNKNGHALYFSRFPIPTTAISPEQEWLKHSTYYKHIGIYGYRTDTLLEIAGLTKTNLEITEVAGAIVLDRTRLHHSRGRHHTRKCSIDTPEDLAKVNR